jgi:hypothetical protein
MALASRHPVAVLEGDGSKPCDESRRLARSRQLSIRLDESLLRSVLGKVIIPQNRGGVRDRDVLIRADQFRKSEIVASLGRAR